MDEGGEYSYSRCTGYEPEVVCLGSTDRSQHALSLVRAALRQGPLQSKRQAITRLAAHKKLASNEQQLTLLVADYATDLDEFPEYVVHAVCDFYRKEDESGFMPTVAAMRNVCRSLESALKAELVAPLPGAPKATEKKRYEPPPVPTEEENKRRQAWLAIWKKRDLTEQELAAWSAGRMPDA